MIIINSPVNLHNLVSFQLVVKALLVAFTTSITFTTSTHISKCLFLVPFTGLVLQQTLYKVLEIRHFEMCVKVVKILLVV